jgi:hypothetical protein
VNGAVFLSASSEHSALYRQNRKSLQDAWKTYGWKYNIIKC